MSSKIWTVRFGTDGTGMDMFHVYAADMDTARRLAADGLRYLGCPLTAERGQFTVHRHGDENWRPLWSPLQKFIANRPAMDYADMLRKHTDVVLDLNLADITA